MSEPKTLEEIRTKVDLWGTLNKEFITLKWDEVQTLLAEIDRLTPKQSVFWDDLAQDLKDPEFRAEFKRQVRLIAETDRKANA